MKTFLRSCILYLFIIAPCWGSFQFDKISTSEPWGPIAAEVCNALDDAVNLYQKDDIAAAHLASNMAYFKIYDSKLEPAVRTTIGGKHAFIVEQQFRELTQLMVQNPSAQDLEKVQQARDILCQQNYADAKILNQEHITPNRQASTS